MNASPHTLFISDLHLSHDRPEIAAWFLAFMEEQAPAAKALYILGDLFEIWLGDDAMTKPHGVIVEKLRWASDNGLTIYFMHGNRDFLIGDGFAKASGCKILPDPCVIDLYKTPTLLTHGDLLCTDDVDYQRFRAQVRNPDMQRQFLSLPIEERIKVGQQYRIASMEASKGKSEQIMDVNQSAVEAMLRKHGVRQMIHGHTHRPGFHDFDLDGNSVRRIVLGDWYEQGSQLYCDTGGCKLVALPK